VRAPSILAAGVNRRLYSGIPELMNPKWTRATRASPPVFTSGDGAIRLRRFDGMVTASYR
jgi:hypothetical protein